jgi:drug/metabolite transporter (DMT)-like permease
VTYANLPAAILRKGVIISSLSAVSLGASVVFVPLSYRAGVQPGMAVFLRFLVATVVLTAFLRLSGRWVHLPRRNAVAIFLLGLFGYTVMGITFYVALSLIPAWLVGLMTALYPLAINFGSWLFLREPVTRSQFLALLAVLAGGVFLFLQPFEGFSWPGVLLMLLNIFWVSVYLLVGQRWTRGMPPTMSATWTVGGATIGTLAYALTVGQFSFNFAPLGWLWIFCFGVISTALAILMLWWGVGLIGAARASIIGSFEPLAAILLAVLFLGESVSPGQIAGAVLILAGMFLVQWQPAR